MRGDAGVSMVMFMAVILMWQGVASEIHITSLEVPKHAAFNSNQTLACHYDVGSHVLYSLLWFHNDQEFYRYMPAEKPPIVVFNISSINVIKEGSTGEKVMLANVDLSASGSYKCKITTEWPDFMEKEMTETMTVVVIPEEQPSIEGDVDGHYRDGDMVNLNCTAAPSIPAAILVWYINDKEAPEEYVQEYEVQQLRDGLLVSSLGLNFKLSRSDFIKHELKLKCTANIATLYSGSYEHSQQVPTTSTSAKEVLNRPEEGSLVTAADPGSGSTLVVDGLIHRLLVLHVVLLIYAYLLR